MFFLSHCYNSRKLGDLVGTGIYSDNNKRGLTVRWGLTVRYLQCRTENTIRFIARRLVVLRNTVPLDQKVTWIRLIMRMVWLRVKEIRWCDWLKMMTNEFRWTEVGNDRVMTHAHTCYLPIIVTVAWLTTSPLGDRPMILIQKQIIPLLPHQSCRVINTAPEWDLTCRFPGRLWSLFEQTRSKHPF